jgi:hypothetical protein
LFLKEEVAICLADKVGYIPKRRATSGQCIGSLKDPVVQAVTEDVAPAEDRQSFMAE